MLGIDVNGLYADGGGRMPNLHSLGHGSSEWTAEWHLGRAAVLSIVQNRRSWLAWFSR